MAISLSHARWLRMVRSKYTDTGYRLFLRSKKSTYLFVLAGKVGDIPDKLEIQQSDYVAVWDENEPLKKKTGLNKIKEFKTSYREGKD